MLEVWELKCVCLCLRATLSMHLLENQMTQQMMIKAIMALGNG